MIVNSNAASLFTRRALGRSGSSLEIATARLASGVRINSAADDAAGLAISDRMSTQVNGQGQARRNVNDAVSMAQTAEGALQQSADVLQRIRQLAVQAANGTNSQQDRASLQAEVDQLVAEFDRVSKDTEFNSRKLLDGSSLTASVHVGYKGWQAVGLGVQSSRAEDLYSYELGSDISTTSSMQAAQTATSDGHAGQRNRLQTQNLAINGRGMTGAAVLQAGLSAKEVADRMNHALVQKDGLLAARAETYALMTFASSQSASVSLKLNGVSIQAYADRADTDVDGVITAINNESALTKVVASKQALSGGGVGVVLHAAQGEDIQLSHGGVSEGGWLASGG
jgi:flagellin